MTVRHRSPRLTTSFGQDLTYLAELREQWRPLTAALIGMASGLSMLSYVTSIMAPQLLQAFGWSQSSFAMIGSLGLISVATLPVVGRLADLLGVRKTAMIGVICGPLVFLALALFNGDIRIYIALYVVHSVFCITTTATVYSRTVVQHVVRARGLALAIVASGPALTGVIGAPLLNEFVIAHGWRAGYLAVAAFSTVAGVAAISMLPAEAKRTDRPVRRGAAKIDYAEILHNEAFWVLIATMLLCNLPNVLALTQMKLLLLDNGVTSGGASLMISIFAAGVLLGRFACGIALDRWSPHLIAACSLSLPAIGLYLIASPFDAAPVLMLSVLLIGLSFGAEGDLVAYLVVRSFGVRLFSSVMGLMTAATAISTSLGALLLGWILALTGSFVWFLTIGATSVIVGSLLLLRLPRPSTAQVTTSSEHRDAI